MFLARRNLTAHPLRSLLTALAIALGVAMVLAAAIIGQAASEQATTLAEASGPRIDLEIFARDQKPFAEEALTVVRANLSVEIASPSLNLEASASNLDASRPISLAVLGVDPTAYQALRKPNLADGTFLAADNTIVVPTALAVRNGWRTEDELQLGVSDRVVQVTLSGRLKSEAGIPLGATPSALVPLSIAQHLAGAPGQIDRIEIQLRVGATIETTRAELANALGVGFAVAQVVVGGGPSFSTLTLQALLALVGVIILFAAGFVIANAFGMSVTARLKEFGALRTLGLTRRGVLNLVLLEAGGLGVVGAVGGVLLGLSLAWVTLTVIGYDAALSVPLWAVAFSPLMGLTVTLVSALLPAWQASRISPMEAVKSEGNQTLKVSKTFRVSTRLGGIALAVIIAGLGVFGFVGRPDFTTGLVVLLPSMVVLLAAMALLMPALVAPIATLVQPLLQRWPGGTAGRLAADNLRRNPMRAALTAAAMTAGLTMIIATSGLIPTIFKGGLDVFVTKVHEDRVTWPAITPGALRFDNVVEALIDAPPQNPEMAARLKELERSGAIELIDYDIARIPSELSAVPNHPGFFVEPEAFIRSGDFDFSEGNPEDALKLMQRGRAVLIAPTVAARLNVHVGDPVKVQTTKGEVVFTVAGIGGVWIIMAVFPYADGQTYFGVGEPTMFGIVAKAGPDKEATLQRVDAIAKDYSVLALNPADGFTLFDEAYDQLVLVLNALLLMAVVVAGLGVVNTLVISVTERKREIGMLRAIGATQRQVRQMVMAEGATLGLLSVIFAMGLSLIILVAFVLLGGSNGMASLGMSLTSQQFVDTLSLAVREMAKAALACLFIAPLVAALAAYWPAKQAAAMDVMDATRSEQLTLQPVAALREEGEPERDLPTSFTAFFVARVVQEQRTRFILSILAVTIGVATTIASDYVGSSILAVVQQNEDIKAIGGAMGQVGSWIKLVGVSVSLAVGFLIFNTFAMSFTQRRQQLGTLRTLGTSRRQILYLAFVEAALIGVLGLGLGVITGQLMGRGFIALLRATSDVLNTFVETGTSFSTYALACGLGLGVPLLAMLVPALNAARVSPLVALKVPESNPVGARSPRPYLVSLLLAPLLLLLRPPNLAPPWDTYGVMVLGLGWVGILALTLPVALQLFAALSRRLLQRGGAVGLLMADNLRRAQTRTLITAITLTVGITLIITLAGAAFFYAQELVRPKFEAVSAQQIAVISTFDISTGLAAYTPDRALRLLPNDIVDLQAEFADRAIFISAGFVPIPELSALGDTTASFVLDPAIMRDHFPANFTFTEGDWEHAFPLMEHGCGVLIAPFVAKRNNVQLYDTLRVTSPLGKQVPCVIAGIGELVSGVSIISAAASTDFDAGEPFFLYAGAAPGHDTATLFADIEQFIAPRGLHLIEVGHLSQIILQFFDLIPVIFNAILFFAILAAALGVFNTTLISLHERRRELGQLRAVGMTRRQTTWVVVGEALLIGVFGAGLSLIAGAGFIFIIVLTFGGNSMGFANFPIYAAAFHSLRVGMFNGLVAFIISPLLCGLAAYLPVRNLMRGAAIDTLNPEQVQPLTRQRLAGVFNRGSIQTRFVLGTAVLLLVVLASLIQVVIGHARNYLVTNLRDTAVAMVGWNAAMIEASLPADAQTIDLDQLAQAQGQNFDADALLRFRSLIDDMTAGGLKEFVLADRDNVVVISFDQRDMGATLDPLEDVQKTTARETSVDGDPVPQVSATAPLHNHAGDLVGSLRMTLRFEEIQIFLNRVRTTLWALGGVILALGLVASYLLSLPFTRAARSLATHTARISHGDYLPITNYRNSPISNLSIRTRLTLLMTLLVVLLVSLMGLIVIPIEREELDRTSRVSVLTMIQWMGDFISESLPTDFSDLQNFDLARALSTVQNLDFARLQALTEQTRTNGLTYLTIADTTGTVVLSDKLALQGEPGLTAARAQISEGEWQGEKIVIGSTPLRQGRDGEQIGTLSLAFSNAQIEVFLTEAQNLFWLTGLIAVLGGLLLAQALGGAVAAPVEDLTLGARRVAQGDLSVKFGTRVTGDELSQLAHAFNQMAAGLREREKLRDLFGKYVSPEVREAIESGRVTLSGERKTITCLYVDMRGSTAFADQHQPEEVMAALNEYFEVIILAVETYGGIVNRFVGDEAVCIFGAPTDLPDHAEAALNAALAMRHGLAYLNLKRETRNLPTLKFGIGINTGEVIAGATGSTERQEYTLIGDAMNVGARIEQLNKTFPDHDILLSEFTRAALGEGATAYAFIDLGEVEIRGKRHALRVWGLARNSA